MPYVPVPKDLSRVKSKLAFGLTKRQLVCFALAALTGIPFYLFTRGAIGNDAAALLMVLLMLPFFAFALYERDGQPLEKVLYHYLRARHLVPRTRPYRTNNLYAALIKQSTIDREVEKLHESVVRSHVSAKKAKKAAATAKRRKA